MIAIIDIGGTSIKYGVIDSETEKYQLIGNLDTNPFEKGFKMEIRLSEVMDDIQLNHEVKGIAISTAGIVDQDAGTIIYANKNIPNYKGTKLKEVLERKYKVPVSVENDVNAALLGEINFGNLESVHSAMMLTVGTGVGGALYLNGGIYHGYMHSAGEIGYTIINGENIEDIASTTALVKNVKLRIDNKNIDGKWIFNQAIHHQNQICIEEINKLVFNLSYLISNNISLINPQVIILGGGIMEQIEYLQPLIENKLKEINKNKLVVNHTKLLFATLGNQAGMLGAFSHYKNLYLNK